MPANVLYTLPQRLANQTTKPDDLGGRALAISCVAVPGMIVGYSLAKCEPIHMSRQNWSDFFRPMVEAVKPVVDHLMQGLCSSP